MNDLRPRPAAGMAVILVLLATAGRGETPPTPPREPARAPRSARPASTKPDSLAQRLCDALHTLPTRRKKECCGRAPPSLAAVCAQELSASIRNRAVGLDAATIDWCAAETSRQLERCDWVTPLMPKLPDACRNIAHGRLKGAGARCRSSFECPDGLFCKGVRPGKDGICAAPGASRTRCEVPADNLAAFT